MATPARANAIASSRSAPSSSPPLACPGSTRSPRPRASSQQPISQSQNESGWSYEYRVPKAGGGTEIKSVQQQTLDRSHPGQGHWEAGKVKVDPDTGKIRYNKYGRPKLDGTKSKVDYDE